MSQATGLPVETHARIDARAVGVRLGVLLALFVVAFRGEIGMVLRTAASFSEWSHVFSLPFVAFFFVSCRRDDLRSVLTGGSSWGIVVILGGATVWLVPEALGQFGFAKLLGMWVCLAGLVLAAVGRRTMVRCTPLLLMAGLCLPLGERTMESKSLALQRISLRAAVTALDAMPGIEARVDGTAIAYRAGDAKGVCGLAEQRFSARLMPAYLMVGLYVVFSRRRSRLHIAVLALASLPIGLFCNILRMDVWVAVSALGGFDLVSAMPRNVAFAVSLMVAYGLFAAGCGMLSSSGRLAWRIFTVEDEESDEGIDGVGQGHCAPDDEIGGQ